MSTKEEKIRKQLMDERQKQDAQAREIEAARLEEEKRKAAALLEDEELKDKPLEEITPVNFQATETESGDWVKIIEDYKAKYPESPIVNNVLVFPTKDDAISFFAEQAAMEPPRKFLVKEVGPDGKPTGFNVFSCGDGKLYKGTYEEIQEQLKAAQLENPDDPNIKQGLATIAQFVSPNPAQSFKETLLKNKEPEEANEHAVTPLGTVPKRG